MDIKPNPADVKEGTLFGENNTEVGTMIGEKSVEINTGRIIVPISETESLILD